MLDYWVWCECYCPPPSLVELLGNPAFLPLDVLPRFSPPPQSGLRILISGHLEAGSTWAFAAVSARQLSGLRAAFTAAQLAFEAGNSESCDTLSEISSDDTHPNFAGFPLVTVGCLRRHCPAGGWPNSLSECGHAGGVCGAERAACVLCRIRCWHCSACSGQ